MFEKKWKTGNKVLKKNFDGTIHNIFRIRGIFRQLFGIRLELRNSKGIFLENGSNIYKAAEGTES